MARQLTTSDRALKEVADGTIKMHGWEIKMFQSSRKTSDRVYVAEYRYEHGYMAFTCTNLVMVKQIIVSINRFGDASGVQQQYKKRVPIIHGLKEYQKTLKFKFN